MSRAELVPREAQEAACAAPKVPALAKKAARVALLAHGIESDKGGGSEKSAARCAFSGNASILAARPNA